MVKGSEVRIGGIIMPRIYATVSIYGETCADLNAFLVKHRSKYPTIVGFIDEAVREKMERESVSTSTSVPNMNLLFQDMGGE